MTTKYDTTPLAQSGFGSWLHAVIPEGDDRAYGKPPVDCVDLGWSEDGTYGGYRNVGEFATVAEARVAMTIVDRCLVAGECPEADVFLKRNGFAIAEQTGLSATRPPWTRRLDDGFLAVFGVLDPDLSVFGPTGEVVRVGNLRIPHAMRSRFRNAAVVHCAALLPILEARIAAGDPTKPLASD